MPQTPLVFPSCFSAKPLCAFLFSSHPLPYRTSWIYRVGNVGKLSVCTPWGLCKFGRTSPVIFNLRNTWEWVVSFTPWTFYPDVYWIGSHMGFWTGLDTSEKVSVAPSGNRSTTVHPVASWRRIKVMTFVMEFYLFSKLVELFKQGPGDGITWRPQSPW